MEGSSVPGESREIPCSKEHYSFENCMKLKIFETNCILEKFDFLKCVQEQAPYVAIKTPSRLLTKKIETGAGLK